MTDFRAAGMRVSVKKAEGGHTVTAKAAPQTHADIPFFTPYGIELIPVRAGEESFIDD